MPGGTPRSESVPDTPARGLLAPPANHPSHQTELCRSQAGLCTGTGPTTEWPPLTQAGICGKEALAHALTRSLRLPRWRERLNIATAPTSKVALHCGSGMRKIFESSPHPRVGVPVPPPVQAELEGPLDKRTLSDATLKVLNNVNG